MKIIFIFPFLLFAVNAFSQPDVEYFYDAAGQRVQRVIVVLMIMDTTLDNNTTQAGTNTVVPEGVVPAVNSSDSGSGTRNEEAIISKSGGHTFKIYPNPTRGEVLIETGNDFIERDNKSASVFDLNGKLLQQKPIDLPEFLLDFSAYAPGQYIVRITATGYRKEFKVVKQ